MVIPAASTSPPGTVSPNEYAPPVPTHLSPSRAPTSRSSSHKRRSRSNSASLNVAANASPVGWTKARISSAVGWRRRIGSSVIVQSCHARRRPLSDFGQLLGVGLGRREQIAALGDAVDDGPDRPAVGSQILVVQLVPGDWGGHGRTCRGPNGIRRDQRLDRSVLRVVQTCLALTVALRPLPRDELRNG